MKNLYQMSSDVANLVLRGYEFSLTSSEIMASVQAYITSLPKRTPQYYKTALNQVAMATKDVKQNDYIVFGYWMEGKFFTTYKGGNALVKKYNLETTEVLHNKSLTMAQWDSLRKGTYYASNLKTFFE